MNLALAQAPMETLVLWKYEIRELIDIWESVAISRHGINQMDTIAFYKEVPASSGQVVRSCLLSARSHLSHSLIFLASL